MLKFDGKTSGFTIVELLIVIVIVGILAAISIVAYDGVQKSARDSVRKQDLANLAKAIGLYAAEVGDHVEKGCGSGLGSGWLHSDYDGAVAHWFLLIIAYWETGLALRQTI